MATMQIEAEPYPLELEPESTALLIIDMQRDFVEPGGFGELLGNDVSLLRSTIEPCRRVLEAARRRGSHRDPHPRGPPAGPGLRAALQAEARRPQGRHRRPRARWVGFSCAASTGTTSSRSSIPLPASR